MKPNHALLAVLIFALCTIAILYFSFDRIVLFVAAQRYSLEISYTSLKNEGYRHFVFGDLTIIDKKRGVGFFSAHAATDLSWKAWPPKDVTIGFTLRDVHFVKHAKETKEAYDDLSGLIAVPFRSKWTYKEISGNITMIDSGIRLNNVVANSDIIRISLAGEIQHNNTIDTSITIYFSRDLTRKIPDELSNVVMRDESDGWKSLSVQLRGNYKEPSIKVSGKLFRLNIGLP